MGRELITNMKAATISRVGACHFGDKVAMLGLIVDIGDESATVVMDRDEAFRLIDDLRTKASRMWPDESERLAAEDEAAVAELALDLSVLTLNQHAYRDATDWAIGGDDGRPTVGSESAYYVLSGFEAEAVANQLTRDAAKGGE